MLDGMVSDRLVYRAADRIIALFGESAPDEVSPLIREAIGQHDRDRAILLFRIRVAILLMQSPPSQVSHKAGDGRYTFSGLSDEIARRRIAAPGARPQAAARLPAVSSTTTSPSKTLAKSKACLLELKAKSDLPAREEGQLENAGLGPVVIEPCPHLGHDGPQVCARATNLNDVHTCLPAGRGLRFKRSQRAKYIASKLPREPAISSRAYHTADVPQLLAADLRSNSGHSPPSVSLVLAAAWIGIGAALAQEHLPTVPGTCVLTKIASIGDRLQNASIGRPIFGFGSAVTFTNKGYQVSYNQLPVDIPLQRGDGVYMCLMKVPKGCPPGDNRGRIYTTMNLRIWSPGRCRIHLSEQGERKLRGRSEPVRVWISRH